MTTNHMNIKYEVLDTGQRVRVLKIDMEGYLHFRVESLSGDVPAELDCWRDHNGHRNCSAACAAFQIFSRQGRAFAICKALRSSEGISHEVLGVFSAEAAL